MALSLASNIAPSLAQVASTIAWGALSTSLAPDVVAGALSTVTSLFSSTPAVAPPDKGSYETGYKCSANDVALASIFDLDFDLSYYENPVSHYIPDTDLLNNIRDRIALHEDAPFMVFVDTDHLDPAVGPIVKALTYMASKGEIVFLRDGLPHGDAEQSKLLGDTVRLTQESSLYGLEKCHTESIMVQMMYTVQKQLNFPNWDSSETNTELLKSYLHLMFETGDPEILEDLCASSNLWTSLYTEYNRLGTNTFLSSITTFIRLDEGSTLNSYTSDMYQSLGECLARRIDSSSYLNRMKETVVAFFGNPNVENTDALHYAGMASREQEWHEVYHEAVSQHGDTRPVVFYSGDAHVPFFERLLDEVNV